MTPHSSTGLHHGSRKEVGKIVDRLIDETSRPPRGDATLLNGKCDRLHESAWSTVVADSSRLPRARCSATPRRELTWATAGFNRPRATSPAIFSAEDVTCSSSATAFNDQPARPRRERT